MGGSSLDVLKKGLARLKNQVNSRKNDLLSRLHRKETISSEDEHWLDHDGNLVDEALVDSLENASDYERGLGRLDPKQRPLVKKLLDLGTELKLFQGTLSKQICFEGHRPLRQWYHTCGYLQHRSARSDASR